MNFHMIHLKSHRAFFISNFTNNFSNKGKRRYPIYPLAPVKKLSLDHVLRTSTKMFIKKPGFNDLCYQRFGNTHQICFQSPNLAFRNQFERIPELEPFCTRTHCPLHFYSNNTLCTQ